MSIDKLDRSIKRGGRLDPQEVLKDGRQTLEWLNRDAQEMKEHCPETFPSVK